MSKALRLTLIIGTALALWAAALFGQTAPAPAPIDQAKKQAVVDEIAKLLNENYVFPETAKKIEETLRAKLAAGAYNAGTDAAAFARAVSKDLLDVSRDRHIGFAYDPELAEGIRRLESRSEEDVRRERERRRLLHERDNFGFRKVERLPGNIGYLDFRVFDPPDLGGPTAIAALNFLAYCDAVIVDLRQNGGGDTAGIQLICSYFFDEPVHLNDIYIRSTDKTENYWTLPYIPGPRPSKADLYILTSAGTFSGAEEFSYNMQNLKRGTIVGETTGGGAHPTTQKVVQHDFILRVPFARAINPVTKTNWEGTGVKPDVAIPAAQAFDRAYAMAVEKLAAKATDPEVKAQFEWILTSERAKQNPPRLDAKTLKSYAGVYGERKITFENGQLFYQRTGPKYRLVPLTPTLFALDGLDSFRVEFVVKGGQAGELVGLYDDGSREPSARTK